MHRFFGAKKKKEVQHPREPKESEVVKPPNASEFYPLEFREHMKLPIRDVQIHMICIDENSIDDELLLQAHHFTHYKICAVRIEVSSQNYVTGIQARYLNLETG